MRTGSTSKKRQQLDKYIQSRVLISSNSINPLSHHISTKLDLIKKQISRQFHQKFPTQKKRNNSFKKSNSSSKTKFSQQKISQNVNRKLNYNQHKPPHYSNSSQIGRNSINITTQHNGENQNFREKYYQLQDKFLEERKKMLQDVQRFSNFKQKVIEFLEEPTEKGAEQIKCYYLSSQRQRKVIQKCLSLNEYLICAQKTISEILSITQVQDIETLLQQLKSRQTSYKNLGEYSFKIIQLQTAYNKLQKDSQKKLQEIAKQNKQREIKLENQLNKQVQLMESIIQRMKNQKQIEFRNQLTKIFNKIRKMTKYSMVDNSIQGKSAAIILGRWEKDSVKRSRRKNRSELIQRQNSNAQRLATSKTQQIQQQTTQRMIQLILEMFQQMESSVENIQKQAENNMQQLMIAENSLQQLRKRVQQLTQDFEQQKNKLIQHFEKLIDEKQIQLNNQADNWHKNNLQKQENFKKLQIQHNSLFHRIQQQKSKVQYYIKQKQKDEEKLNKKQQIINNIVKIICQTTGEDLGIFGIQSHSNQLHFESLVHFQQAIMSKIQLILKKHLQTLKDNLQAAQNLILWHGKQLEIKEGLLKQFEFNLKRLVDDTEHLQKKEKQITFQRDQYKYLLNNLRQSIVQMRRDQELQIQKLSQQKDEQYLNSNHDILQQNKKLNNQITKFQMIIEQQIQKIHSQTASHSFFRKKCQQLEATGIQARKKLITAEEQVAKHKLCLNQIQVSLKQVQNMSQINTQKMITLQEQNKVLTNQSHQLKLKVKALTAQIQLKDQNYNKLEYSWQQLKKKSQKIHKIKQDLQQQNSNLRLQNLKVTELQRTSAQKIKKIQYENAIISKQNKKCMQQINQLTKRLINYVGDKQLFNRSKEEVRLQIKNTINQQIKILKNCYYEMKIYVKDYLDQTQQSIKQQSDQILRQFISYANAVQVNMQHRRQKYRNSQDSRQKQDNKSIIIQKAKNNMLLIKQDVNNLGQYCKYIKDQFKNQISFIRNIIQKPSLRLEQQKQRLTENCSLLLKINLIINSLRNQKDNIIQIIQSDKITIGNMMAELQRKLCNQISNAINSNNSNIVCPNCYPNIMDNSKNVINLSKQQNQQDLLQSQQKPKQKKQQQNQQIQEQLQQENKGQSSLNKYLAQKSIEKKHNTQQQEFMSPQFVKIRKGTSDSKSNHNYEHQLFNQQENDQRNIKTQRNYSNNPLSNFKLHIPLPREREEQSFGKIRSSGVTKDTQEVQRVRRILLSLKQIQQQPRVPYFQLIKKQYRQIKRRLQRNMNLDISGVSFKPATNISSPSSASFTKDFIFDKKFNTQPNEQVKQSNRQQYKNDCTLVSLKKQNEQLKEQIQKLEEQVKILEYKYQQTKITVSQLEKKLVELQNSSSQQMKQKLFLKFMNDLNNQNWEQAEICCRTFLKLLKLSNTELDQKMDKFKNFVAKHTKKNNHGLLSGLFNKNSKN